MLQKYFRPGKFGKMYHVYYALQGGESWTSKEKKDDLYYIAIAIALQNHFS